MGKGDRHGHRETFGDSNHNQDDAQGDVLCELLHEDFATDFAISSGLNAKNDDGSDEDHK